MLRLASVAPIVAALVCAAAACVDEPLTGPPEPSEEEEEELREMVEEMMDRDVVSEARFVLAHAASSDSVEVLGRSRQSGVTVEVVRCPGAIRRGLPRERRSVVVVADGRSRWGEP